MDINDLFKLAVEHHQKGDLREAENLYRKILEIEPTNFFALHSLGVLCLQHGYYDFAIEYIKRALEINSFDASAFYNLGFAFQRKGILHECITYYQKSIELNPNYANTHYNLGHAFRLKERPNEAIDCFQKALRLSPNFSEASIALNIALKEKEQMSRKFESIDWINLIGKKLRLESQCHPHCEEEKAYLFHTFDGGGTEIEVLNFLRSLIILFKSKLVLETGTWDADGTVALGTALKENGVGKLFTLEIDSQKADKAKKKIQQSGLSEYVQVINQSSLEFIEQMDSSEHKFDFVFFDSKPSIRPVEFQKLYDKGALTDLIAFHDTSRLRGKSYIDKEDPQDEYIRHLDEIESKFCRGGIEFPLSKGIRIMQLRDDINPAFYKTRNYNSTNHR